MGRPLDPDYWRRWREAHPEYREREHERQRARRSQMTPEQRRRDRGTRPPVPRDDEPLAILMPELQHGAAVAFWEDELRLDLAQEAWLAALENRDRGDAVSAYRRREIAWRYHTRPLDGHDDHQ